MGYYDQDRNLVYGDERYICRCMECGREGLKRVSECILHRTGSGIPKVIGYLCQKCYADLLDRFEVPG